MKPLFRRKPFPQTRGSRSGSFPDSVHVTQVGLSSGTSASSVNLFLGNVVRQFARKRIDRLDAVALTYMSQMLLNSLSAIEREQLQNLPLVW